MLHFSWLPGFFLGIFILFPCSSEAAGFKNLDWQDLIPESLKKSPLSAPPPIDHSFQGGTLRQSMPWGHVAIEDMVVAALHRQRVRIAGFLVPLNLNENNMIDEFLLVPYFGACIHVPPPPPNQIVHVSYSKGINPDKLYEPFNVTGLLEVGMLSSALADAAYKIVADKIELYVY